jgi:hypothetical protein
MRRQDRSHCWPDSVGGGATGGNRGPESRRDPFREGTPNLTRGERADLDGRSKAEAYARAAGFRAPERAVQAMAWPRRLERGREQKPGRSLRRWRPGSARRGARPRPRPGTREPRPLGATKRQPAYRVAGRAELTGCHIFKPIRRRTSSTAAFPAHRVASSDVFLSSARARSGSLASNADFTPPNRSAIRCFSSGVIVALRSRTREKIEVASGSRVRRSVASASQSPEVANTISAIRSVKVTMSATSRSSSGSAAVCSAGAGCDVCGSGDRDGAAVDSGGPELRPQPTGNANKAT